ncbi:hypothetical protein APUTEX25_005631 [Auxenochlorella protothecoides]|uniref:DNA2/NAM7 helicase-like C-terminal domain-containing protein n=1 Tax=Auxenochlorella protothecoides TaxID=3075 RepID=A0A3M7KVY3_AUXPR|nr:hypothetical protein APUTEX25_005631 [Auxenochlorella protothecoides]|eukprot:RMZ53885.1 hypothetical protein APUTEX25_005631 [Auxenochlorella protothecoides]
MAAPPSPAPTPNLLRELEGRSKELIDRLEQGVQAEIQAQRDRVHRLVLDTPLPVLQRRGLVLVGLAAAPCGTLHTDLLVRLTPPEGTLLSRHSFVPGQPVAVKLRERASALLMRGRDRAPVGAPPTPGHPAATPPAPPPPLRLEDSVPPGMVASVVTKAWREADALSEVAAARRLGFLADRRRVNVAITRARRGLVVLGCSALLRTHPVWREWLREAGHVPEAQPQRAERGGRRPRISADPGCYGSGCGVEEIFL